jgi:rRNA-processing protein FCF1
MIKVIFDTNFLMYSIDFKDDIFQAIEDTVNQRIEKILLSPVLAEIQHLTVCGSNKIKRRAKKTLELIQDKRLKFQTIDIQWQTSTEVDQVIATYAQKNQCYIATNDKELRKTLRKAGIPIIFIRQRSRIGVLR